VTDDEGVYEADIDASLGAIAALFDELPELDMWLVNGPLHGRVQAPSQNLDGIVTISVFYHTALRKNRAYYDKQYIDDVTHRWVFKFSHSEKA
jgi:hypothetical protein